MWSAGILYDEGRCGSVAIYGLASRAEAIAWLARVSEQDRLYLLPSCWIRPMAKPVEKA